MKMFSKMLPNTKRRLKMGGKNCQAARVNENPDKELGLKKKELEEILQRAIEAEEKLTTLG